MTDLPSDLVERLERSLTTSPAGVRDEIYATLAEHGVDVRRLVDDARKLYADELREKIEKRRSVTKMLKDRIFKGLLPSTKLEEAKDRLAAAPADMRSLRYTLRKIEERPAPQLPSAPTRELVRHKGQEPTVETKEPNGQPLSAPRHRFGWAVDTIAVSLNADQYSAAERLRWAYHTRTNTPKGVDWNGAGGGAPGSRLPITEAQLRAGKEWNAIWLKLPPEIRFVVSNFVLEEAPRGRERCLNPVEFGQAYGSTKDPNRARGVTVGALKATLTFVARLFDDYDRWKREQKRLEKGSG